MRLLSCREVSGLVARGEFEETRGPRKALAWLHLLYCRHCRKFRRQLRLLARAARLRAERLVEPARLAAFEKKLIGSLI